MFLTDCYAILGARSSIRVCFFEHGGAGLADIGSIQGIMCRIL